MNNNITDKVFTEVDENINLEVNNITATCINSKNNSFSLDSEGNLIVNSITSKNNQESNLDFNSIYPIGSIYLSVSNTNPNKYFGGVWEQISGYYLYAGSSVGTGGSTVSGATSLTLDQMPSHTHYIPSLSGASDTRGEHSHQIGADFDGAGGGARYTVHSRGVDGAGYLKPTNIAGSHSHNISTVATYSGSIGGNASHTHTINPPYFNVFVWKRIS